MRSILLLLCLSIIVSLKAQEFKLSFSALGEVKKDATKLHKYGNNLYSSEVSWGKKLYAYSAANKKVKYGVGITMYDENLKVVKQLSLDNGENNLGPITPIVHWGDKSIYVIYFKFEDTHDVKMCVSKINPDDLTVVVTREIMHYDFKNKDFWGTLGATSGSEIFYTVSQDGNSAWIVHTTPLLMLTCVIDADLNIIQKVESIPITPKTMEITGFCISNDGNKAMAYNYDDPELRKFLGRGLFYQPANAKGAFKPIKLKEDYFPRNMALAPSKDGKKICIAGGYCSKDFDIGEEGVLYGEVNVEGQKLLDPKFHPFTAEINQRVLDLAFASQKKGKVVFTSHPYYRISEL
jgi:hypothetical protein